MTPHTNSGAFGQRFRSVRQSRRLSQEAAATILGVTSVTISRWESGASLVQRRLKEDVASFLEISTGELSELLGESSQSQVLAPNGTIEIAKGPEEILFQMEKLLHRISESRDRGSTVYFSSTVAQVGPQVDVSQQRAWQDSLAAVLQRGHFVQHLVALRDTSDPAWLTDTVARCLAFPLHYNLRTIDSNSGALPIDVLVEAGEGAVVIFPARPGPPMSALVLTDRAACDLLCRQLESLATTGLPVPLKRYETRQAFNRDLMTAEEGSDQIRLFKDGIATSLIPPSIRVAWDKRESDFLMQHPGWLDSAHNWKGPDRDAANIYERRYERVSLLCARSSYWCACSRQALEEFVSIGRLSPDELDPHAREAVVATPSERRVVVSTLIEKIQSAPSAFLCLVERSETLSQTYFEILDERLLSARAIPTNQSICEDVMVESSRWAVIFRRYFEMLVSGTLADRPCESDPIKVVAFLESLLERIPT